MDRQPFRAPFEVWWLKPSWSFGGMASMIAVLTLAVPAGMFEERWKTLKYYGWGTFMQIAACVMVFLLGYLTVKKLENSAPTAYGDWRENIPWPTALFIFRLSFGLCLFGYAMWVYSAIAHGVTPGLILGALTGAKGATYDLRSTYLITISGVTTMSQFGIPVIVLGSLIGFGLGWRKVLAPMAIVVALGCFRAIVNSERLAAIELAVPILVICVHLHFASRRKHSRVLAWTPLMGAAAVAVIFTACEYSRSWVTFYSGSGKSLWAFAADRLLGYYVTALNNSAYLMKALDGPVGAPYYTLAFLWRFPGVGEFVQNFFHGAALRGPDDYMRLLANGANPELNNTGGILLPVIDYGLSAGLLYWLAFGMAIRVLYKAFLNRTAAGLCLYPACFIGLLEIPRIFYWADQRFFPAFCMLVLSAIVFSLQRPREQVFLWARGYSTT